MKILICEDQEEIARLHEINLKRIANVEQIDFAYTGGEAVEMLERKRYDLILCDQNLGDELSGLDLLLSVRKSALITPFILCTSMEPPLIKKDKNYYFLHKPYKINELADAINSLIQN